jgi:hypothetical protein
MKNWRRVLVSSAFLWSLGCGGGSSNDQGVSFTFLGFNAADEEGICQEDVFTSWKILPLSFTSDIGAGGALNLQCASAVNNMCTQGVRIDRALIRYTIAGSTMSVPSTTVPVSGIFPPAECEDAPDSSLPDGFGGGRSNRALLIFDSVSADVWEFLSVNRNNLPETPFTMEAEVVISGVTTSGQRIESNPMTLDIKVGPDITINPSGGSSSDESVTSEVAEEETDTSTDEAELTEDDEGTV